ncbi:hypothetical protein BDZ91DRAFT_652753 [Kalaharituber pfeilii]|nr:hypothetical protein BDZ91DRAFT_652753 [Kalaharituber pfeilii]
MSPTADVPSIPAEEQSTETNIIATAWSIVVGHNKDVDESTPLLTAQNNSTGKTVNYLAYGSNLCKATFLGRRGIRPLSANNVVVPGQVLAFDLPGIPYWEPTFANINESHAERSTGEVWRKALIGVVYEVTEEDYATIIKTEGGGSGYADIEVDCWVLPSSEDSEAITPASPIIRAHTLRAPLDKTIPNPVQASRRYLNLIITGAKEHAFPSQYITYLSSLHPYRRTTWRQQVGANLFLANWMVPVLTTMKIEHTFADPKTGRTPEWLRKCRNVLWAAVWGSYRMVYKPVWGSGECTIGEEPGAAQVLEAETEKRTGLGVLNGDVKEALEDVEGEMVDAVGKTVEKELDSVRN